MNEKALRKQLSNIGINKAQAEFMSYDGSPAIRISWQGETDYFFGYYEDLDYYDRPEVERRFEQFKDENLS